MAVSSIKDFWIHPNALTITLNYFGDPQLIQTSMLAGAVIMAYRKDVISYDAAHNFREWKLQAFPTQLNDTCVYYVHAELSRSGDTAMIIYSPVKRDIQGRTLLRVEKDEDGRDVEVWDNTTSIDSYFIYLGTISASVDNDGATVERAWTDGFYTGTLDTDQQRMEEVSGDWKTMFSLNSVTGLIDVLKTISSATINALTVTKEFIFGGKSLTGVAGTGDTLDQSKVNDATLPTTGYVQKEIEALDDHFLIKDDPDADQSVAGNVTFGRNVEITGDQHIAGTQEVVGLQTLHNGFMTKNFNDVGGQIRGAQLTKDGVFTAAGLISMSFNVFELVYNKIRATGSKLALNATATIAGCRIVMKGGGELTPDEFYADDSNGVSNIGYALITFKEDETNGGLIPFENGDILYGYVNKIGDSGQHARGGQCAMHIISSNEEIENANDGGGYGKMTVRVQLYSDAITDEQGAADSAVGNMAPTEGMTLAHRGNTYNANRQASFFIDSQSGNIVMLDGVNSPAIGLENYAVVLGKCPSALYAIVENAFDALKQTDPVVYARYAIFENFIQLDHQMNPIQSERNRGEWSAPVTDDNGKQTNPYTNDVSYYDVVTYQGSLFKCLVTGTTQAPSEGSDWLLLVAKGEDGLTPKPNLLPHSNFDKYDRSQPTEGFYPVVGWHGSSDTNYIYGGNSEKVGNVIENAYEGWNSFRMSVSSAGYKAGNNQSITFKKGITYTLSCVVKSENITTTNDHAHGIVFAIPKDNINVVRSGVDNYGTNGSESTLEIRFSPDASWREQFITFTVNEECSAKLRIFSWATAGQIYITKLKIEESDVATPYVRYYADNNGENGEDGADGKDGEPFYFPNLFKGPNFENVNEDDKILTDWGESTFSKLGYIVENAYEGYNAFRIVSYIYMMKQLVVLSSKPYTVSLMVKQTANHTAFFGVKSDVAVSIEPMSSTQNQLDSSATTDYDKRYKIYTQKTDNYEYVTFKVTPSAEAAVTFVFGNADTSLSHSCYFCRPQLEEGDTATKFSLPMSSLAGPAGEAGPALYPAGEWNSTTEYIRDSLKVPFVYYKSSSASKGTYYVLKANSAKGASQAPSSSNGNDYWEPITSLKYLFTEFLMSNFAMFGSENGGVFYDRYLFSQDGLTNQGEEDVYGNHINGMFKNVGTESKPDWQLTGEFIPNLFLDFKEGAAKVSRFSEPFIKNYSTVVEVDANKNHNIEVSSRIEIGSNQQFSASITETSYFWFRNELVLLPEYNENDWTEDGKHFTILSSSKGSLYGSCFGSDMNFHEPDDGERKNIAWWNVYTIVGVDNVLTGENTYTGNGYSNGSWDGNWFFWKGLRSKFVILTPGTMLKVRLFRHTEEGKATVNHWIIENSSDFEVGNINLHMVENEVYLNDAVTEDMKKHNMMYSHPNFAFANFNYSTEQEGGGYLPIILAPTETLGSRQSTALDLVFSIGNAKKREYCSRAKRSTDVLN